MRKRKQNGRDISGILLLDKPVGISSNEALQKVKRIFYAQKAGHTGSLDPLASGMLPLCFGDATKFSQFLLNANKRYRVVAKLGVKTETGDAEGKIIFEKSAEKVSKKSIEKILKEFTGEISQIPSMYSAIKHNGQPLYKLARQGIVVDRESRKITIYKLDLLDFAKDLIDLEVCCSKGTYIRTLIEDIGDKLNCGAHVFALRRLNCGVFDEKEMVTMSQLENLIDEKKFKELDDLLLPIDSMLKGFPEVNLSEAGAFYIKQGHPIIVPKAPTEGYVALKMKNGRFIGVGEILPDGKVTPRRLIAA